MNQAIVEVWPARTVMRIDEPSLASDCFRSSRPWTGRLALVTAIWLISIFLLPGPRALLGESVPDKAPVAQATAADIQARLKRLGDAKDLDDTVKGKVQELYQQALQELESAKKWATQADHFDSLAASASDVLAKVKEDLAGLSPDPPPIDLQGTLVQLERTLLENETQLTQKRAELAELEAEAKRRAGRRVEIPKLVVDARARLAEVEKQLQSVPAEEPPQLAAARQILTQARRQALEQELLSYDEEPKAYEARTELLPLRRDLAAGQVGLLEREVARWRQIVNSRRQRETDDQLHRARLEKSQANPALTQLAENNAKLAERRKDLVELIVQTTQQWESTNKKLAALEDQFTKTKEKVDAVDTVGLTDAMGLLLRKQRDALPDLREYRRSVSSRQVAIRDGQLELLDLEDRRSELANLDRQVQSELQDIAPGSGEAAREELESAIREALEAEKGYLDALINDANSYFDRLVDLDTAERLLIQETERYAKYADERVLWIRSVTTYGLSDFHHLAQALVWLGDPEAWSQLARGLVLDCWANPHLLAMAILIFAPLFYGRRRLRTKIAEIGKLASRATCCRFFPTIEVVFLTGLLAAAWPGVLWYLAWRLGAGLDTTEFSKAVAAGLIATAAAYLALEIFRYVCREDGLADAHFGWSASSLRVLRKYAWWATVLVLPSVFVAVTMNSQGNDRWAGSLGRLSFAAAMVSCSLLAWRVLRSGGGVYQAVLATRRSGWLGRLRFLWYPMAWIVPLVMAALAMAGYYYTAQQLAGRTVATVWMLLGLVLVRSLLLRWVLVKRRCLAIQQARQRRAAGQCDAEPAGEPAAVSEIPTPTEPNLDLATINTQTRHLLEYSLAVAGFLGVWLIWVDVLPALRVLDRVELWHTLEQADPVTLADLGFAALIFSTALIAARNIPGLLEMTLLQRLPFDAGFRYSIGAVSRYLVTVVGLVAASHVLGMSWVRVQWLVAAISVGLGFGLQEIFANFVSGLIILFERPVRVGDVVTVDDVTGVVSRIRMRATTITNWDRKEFIVPNKEFITGRLLNWTLSDQVNRVVVNVGIAYGSDTRLASQLLMKVAREHPLVVDDPPPRVTFEAFGDNSLNFVLRCYLPDLDSRLDVIHDLHMAVDAVFRQAGIEIAFPQRDIRVRSIDASMAMFGPAAQAASGPPNTPQEDLPDQSKSRRVA